MSLCAFYLPAADWRPECALTGEEARHAQVLRIRENDKIQILDGAGKSAICRVLKSGKKEIRLDILEQSETPVPDSRPVIAIALSKAARRGFFLEKAAELGAWQIWLWQAERSQGVITEKLLAACRNQIRAGAKQCRNPWFPELRAMDRVESVVCSAPACAEKLLAWEEKAGEPVVDISRLGLPGDTVYVVGPEGGLAGAEVEALTNSGFTPVSLGSRALRCETAATLCLGLHWWAAQLAERQTDV